MMSSATVCLLVALLLHLTDAETVQLTAGLRGTISCGITGTYSFPEWAKDASVTISNQGASLIHPNYRDRFSFDQTNNRSLSISEVQLSDQGSYVCTHSGGTNSPQTTVVTVIAPTTTTSPTTSSTTTSSTTTSSTTTSSSTTSSTTTSTTSTASTTTTSPQAPPAKSPSTPRSVEEKGFTKTIMIIVIVCSCAAAAIVVFIVLLVIRHWNHQKEKKSLNEMVDFEGQNVNSRNEFMAISNINIETNNEAE